MLMKVFDSDWNWNVGAEMISFDKKIFVQLNLYVIVLFAYYLRGS